MLLPMILLLASAAPTASCGCGECRTAEGVKQPLHKQTLLTRAETDSFSIYSYDSSWPAAKVGKLAEERRSAIYQHWRGADAPAVWKPKCLLVLHSSRESYLAAVGRGGERTLGSSLVDVQQGVCRTRRVDLLTNSNNQIAALAHELTHVVISDIFSGQRLPRWLDEGIAILADAHEKQIRHASDWNQAKALGKGYSIADLVGLEDYPAASQIPAFYGGSASLTALLARRGDSTKLLKFGEQSLRQGYDQALRDVYQIDGLAELELLWRQSDEQVAYSLAQVIK